MVIRKLWQQFLSPPLKDIKPKPKQDQRRNRRPQFQPRVEWLEDRSLMAVDLQGYSLNAPTSAQWGQTITLASQVRNTGNNTASPYQQLWYLSKDTIGGNSGDILLAHPSGATSYGMPSLGAGGTTATFYADRVLPPSLPSGWSGSTFYVIMRTDSTNTNPNESNENNNFGQLGQGKDRDSINITSPPPDLQGWTTSAPASAQWGQTINLASQVRNAGAGPAVAYQVQWFLSQDTIGGNSGDIPLAHPSGATGYSLPALGAGSTTATFYADRVLPASLPSGWSGSNFHIVMKTDSTNSNPNESNENNNAGQMGQGYDRDSIAITSPVQPPDLQGWTTSVVDSAQWGQTINIAAQVRNAGGPAAAYQVQWFLSQDTIGGNSGDIPLAHPSGATSYSLPALGANSTTASFFADRVLPASLPSGWSGSNFHIVMKTDSTNSNPNESNENNNAGQMGQGYDRDSITITSPAVISGPRVVSHSASGSPVSFIDFTFDKPIYASSFTTADVVLQSSQNSLAVNGISHQGGNTFRVSFNAQTAPGTYTMIIGPNIADSAGNLMNQNGNTTNGETTQDRYTATFNVQASGSLSQIQNAWNQVTAGFVPAVLDAAGLGMAAISSTMNSAISSAASAVSGILPNTAEVTFGVELNGQVNLGLPGFSVELAGMATGYSFTRDFLENNWTISRDFSVNILGASVIFEQYITFDSITTVPSQVTVGLAAAGQFSDALSYEIGELFTASFQAGGSQKLTFSAETTLSTVDFVNNYVEQGNFDSTITSTEFAQALADVFVPYYGDTWWQNVLQSVELVVPVGLLIDLTQSDTVVGILAQAPTVNLAITAGAELSAGAALGLGGQIPLGVPIIQAGVNVSAGVSISSGYESGPLWSATRTNWKPVDPATVVVAPVTTLQNNVAVANLSGAWNSERVFKISVPAGQTKIDFRISGGTGDADIYVKRGAAPTTASYDYFLDRAGNDELISVAFPAAGDWYVMLRGWDAFSGVNLVVSYTAGPAVTTLQNNTPVSNLSGGQGSEKFFKITVPAGQTKVEFKISGGTGDADIYIKKGAAPTTSSYDHFLDQGGNNETITIDFPAAGEWFVMLRGWSDYSGVTLVTRYL